MMATKINYLVRENADPKSSQVSTDRLNPHAQVIETPTEHIRNRSKESTDRWQLKRASGINAPQKMPPLRQVHKQQSLEQLRIMKEHQKIRDFFSKEQEENDGQVSFSQLMRKIPEKTSNKLPLVSKKIQRENNHFHHVPNKVSKKAMSLISRHYQKADSFANNSLFSEHDESKPFEIKTKAETTKNTNKIGLEKLIQDRKQQQSGSRYQTIEINLPHQQYAPKHGPKLRHSVEVAQLRSPYPVEPTMNTSTHMPDTGLLYTEAGNYDFGASLSVQKNSTDSLLEPSLDQNQVNNSQRTNLLYNKPLHGKASSSYNVRMQQPIRLQAKNSIVSSGTGNEDYPSILYANNNSTYEPVNQVRSTLSVDRLRFLNSTGFSSSTSKPDFDQSQMKLYQAVKKQQFEQSRQIVNDQLIPQETSLSQIALEDTYQRTFVANKGAGSKRLRTINNGQQFPPATATTSVQQSQQEKEKLTRNASMPVALGQHSDALQNFSQRERVSISILLQDQYSSRWPNHDPGEEDPLSTLTLNYEDKSLTKAKRLESVLASLKLKRRTKFKAIPARLSGSVEASPGRSSQDGRQTGNRLQSTGMKKLKGREQHTTDSMEERSITQGQHTELEKEPHSAVAKFQMYRARVQHDTIEQDYVSESQDSNEGREIIDDGIDIDRENDELVRNRAKQLQKDDPDYLMKIIKQQPAQRENIERDLMIVHLKQYVPFFEDKSRDLISTLIDKLQCIEFSRRESLMDQGQIGDGMYIIMRGDCGVYQFSNTTKNIAASHHCVAIVGENTVVGEGAILDTFDEQRRDSTVLAHSEVITLKLSKKDYQKILYSHSILERQKRLEFLAALPFFKPWDRVNVVDFNNFAEEIHLPKGKTLYDIGNEPNTIYIVRRGKLIQETIIEIDSYFRYPIDKKSWEIRKNTREVCYKLQGLSPGKIFGHEELLQGYKRRCRVRCLTNCSLVYIHGDKIKNWPQKFVDDLRKNMRLLDLDHITSKIMRYQNEKAKRNQAILDASSLNCHDFSGDRSTFMENHNIQKIQKLLPWINKCRQNATQNQNLLHELKKVTLISSKEEKFIVHKDDPKAMMPSDEFMEKKHARFVMPQEAKNKNEQAGEIAQELNRKRPTGLANFVDSSPKRNLKSSNLAKIKQASVLKGSDWYPWLNIKQTDQLVMPQSPKD